MLSFFRPKHQNALLFVILHNFSYPRNVPWRELFSILV
jgi:hypothetical protein